MLQTFHWIMKISTNNFQNEFQNGYVETEAIAAENDKEEEGEFVSSKMINNQGVSISATCKEKEFSFDDDNKVNETMKMVGKKIGK